MADQPYGIEMEEGEIIDVDAFDDDDDGSNALVTGAPQQRCGQVAVRFNRFVVVFGGYICEQRYFHGLMFHSEVYLQNNEIWLYDVYLNFWKRVYTKSSEYPPGVSGAAGAAIGCEIYMQGGHTDHGNTNTIWKLSSSDGEAAWSEIKIGNQLTTPSPRDKHVCWEFDQKLWIFGGFGPPLGAYLNEYGDFVSDGESTPLRGWNNQLHVFDPANKRWTNLDGTGHVPSPRAAHAVTQIGSKVYLYGGRSGSRRLADMYSLDMLTLQWTSLWSNSPVKPIARSWHSFNAQNSEEIILHAGYSSDGAILNDTWILHVPTLTWSQYKGSADHTRLWHTGAAGEDCVLIFGGCCNNILDASVPNRMCSDTFIVRRQPESLLKLSLMCVYQHKHSTFHEWESLPKELNQELLRLHANDPSRVGAHGGDDITTGTLTACTIS